MIKKYINILNKFKKCHILVVGDLILDQYIKGSVERISPEAPVPIVQQTEMFFTPGGAANVANNLRALGAKVTVVGRIGNDHEGHHLKELLQKQGIKTTGIFEDRRAHTILKTRIMAQHQQIVRVDREVLDDDLKGVFYKKHLEPFFEEHFKDFDGVVISDYGKGLVQPMLLADVTARAFADGVPVIVDPKVEHFQFYGPVTSITPNRKETETALKSLEPDTRKRFGIKTTKLDVLKDIKESGKGLLEYLGIPSLLLTLSQDGMCLIEKGKEPVHIPTRAREVFDVSGAGDTVIATYALGLAAGASKVIAADIANHAAGVVVAKMGAVSVTPEELKRSFQG